MTDVEGRSMAVCPWCGYEHPDSWEFEDGETECHSCEKPFVVHIIETVSYTTSKPEEDDDGE